MIKNQYEFFRKEVESLKQSKNEPNQKYQQNNNFNRFKPRNFQGKHKSKRCYNCNQLGHIKYNCPGPVQNNQDKRSGNTPSPNTSDYNSNNSNQINLSKICSMSFHDPSLFHAPFAHFPDDFFEADLGEDEQSLNVIK
ncbi:unnamed protein product, partial [Brachionus calyciflorus]